MKLRWLLFATFELVNRKLLAVEQRVRAMGNSVTHKLVTSAVVSCEMS